MYPTPNCYYGGPMYMYAMQNDMDEAYMKKMYPESCHEIMSYVEKECVRREQMGQLPDNAYPKKEVVDEMVEVIYEKCKDLFPQDLKDRQRQYGGALLGDLIAILLLGSLFRRRRFRRRRFSFGY